MNTGNKEVVFSQVEELSQQIRDEKSCSVPIVSKTRTAEQVYLGQIRSLNSAFANGNVYI